MKLSILYVEDNMINQKLAEMVIKGHDLTFADDGVYGLEAYQEKSFDLILMDLNLPRMSGLEVTDAIRKIEAEKNLPNIPIVAVTADWDSEISANCKEVGMNDYLMKPFDQDCFAELINKFQTA